MGKMNISWGYFGAHENVKLEQHFQLNWDYTTIDCKCITY